MTFIVERVSNSNHDAPCPVEGATVASLTYLDRRCVDDPEKIPHEPSRKEWWERGKNHTVQDGKIVRELESYAKWVIEIESLPDLMELIDKNDSVILGKSDYKEVPVLIRIYDDYLD